MCGGESLAEKSGLFVSALSCTSYAYSCGFALAVVPQATEIQSDIDVTGGFPSFCH